MTTVLVGILVGTAVLLLAARLWMSRASEGRAAPSEIVDFAQLKPSTRQNIYVMCPAELCRDSANAPSPTFAMRWQRLRDYWEEAVRAQPRTELVWTDAQRRKLVYVQRSAVFQFPDIVTVEFLPAGGGRSTLAVASQSRYGRRDFGVNGERVTAWTDLLVNLMRREEVNGSR
jgi:uncharacterized protein (DUF1499 family)